MCERGEAFGQGELRNNNPPGGVPADGDANANEIQTEDGGVTGDTGNLSGLMSETAAQDKVIIWGTDSQCDDPELAEFEMLECQELEAYLVEDGEDFVGLADRKELQQPLSCSNNSRDEGKTTLCGSTEQESSVSHDTEGREASRTGFSSDTDVFLTCLSTVSSMDTALDTAAKTQTTDSWQFASGPYSTISEDLTLASQTCNTVTERCKAPRKDNRPSTSSGKSTTNGNNVDVNLNSTVQLEVELQAQENRAVVEVHSRNSNRNKTVNLMSEVRGDGGRSTEHKSLPTATISQEQSSCKMDKSTQADESDSQDNAGTKGNSTSTDSKAIKKQGSFDRSFKKQPSFESSLKKQHSFDNSLKKPGSFENSSSSLERRKPWGSPSRPAASSPANTNSASPKRRQPGSPAKVPGARALSLERGLSPQRGQTVKPPVKSISSSSIPKPVNPQQKEPEPTRSSPPQKPKHVRPKIITYVRKNPPGKPQVTDAPPDASNLPMRMTSYSSPPAHKDLKAAPQPKSTAVLCSSNLLFDRYRQEMQKTGFCPPVLTGTGGKPPGAAAPQKLSGKSGSFHEETSDKYLQQQHVSHEGAAVYRSPRALRPQLGLGAVNRQPAAKTRVQHTGQRSTPPPSQVVSHQDHAGEPKRSGDRGPESTPKGLLLKPGQSGLRPPGFSALPASRLASFGFIRSSSVSSVSSNQTNESGHSDPSRASQHPDDPSLSDAPQSRTQPPNAPSLQRRSVPPQRSSPQRSSPQRSSPLASRREMQKDVEAVMPLKNSPKRFAVVSPKPQSPVRGRLAEVPGAARTNRAQELDQAQIQQLRERCEQQALQLQSLQAQLKKASLCLDVFSITTQHFCKKSESAIVKERELSLELARIRDEVAFSVAHWEQLQQEKGELERRFQAELQGLRARQQRELGALEERLKEQHMADTQSLKAQQHSELEDLRFSQQEQMEEMNENHEASLVEMETTHNDTVATLQEEHTRTVKNLKMAHEQQTKSLEEEFEKIRLSLQDQVDTLLFQNRSLRDRAKRFEEALRRSTDEQIVDALAPYKHIEEDLKSLKEILEMKNQQIHEQELKITELEKIQAEKNVYLEERLQVLQQQNEDLKERIHKNLAVSRQLSEENANLQVNVEKESNEKKRLSRTNEELLWRLQTGELSPRMSPSASPIHRPASGPGSPARPHSYHQ